MKYGSYDPASTLLVAVDLQERLVPAVSGFDRAGLMIGRLLDGAAAMGIDTVVSEQYPQGLGKTMSVFSERLSPGTPVIEKRAFSVFGEPAFRQVLDAKRRETLIFCGIEADICVLQSVFDAINAGFRVIMPYDAVASRREADCAAAVAAARQAGALTTSTDSVLFMLLRDSRAPQFKTISKLVR